MRIGAERKRYQFSPFHYAIDWVETKFKYRLLEVVRIISIFELTNLSLPCKNFDWVFII